jgi:cytochrome c oxidase subunit 3/cytochrome o ubiquinol oxidase subunit 3
MADAVIHAADALTGGDAPDEIVHETTTGLSNNKLAMWLFLGSECLLFGGLISTYMLYRGRHTANLGPDQVWDIPFTSVSSFILLMSSLTMVLALAAVENRGKPGYEGILGSSKLWLLATAILGTTFLGFQAFEFTSFVHEGLTIRTNLFGSSFFTLTGFHGAHVTAGVLWLLTLLSIDIKRGLQPKDALLVDISALYWHFVDVVWIAIFTLVYLIR